jgi:lipopolysaccharide transport system ATP-binding protein
MSKDVLVTVENVSKKFCRDLKRSLWYGVKDVGSELLGSRHSRPSLRKGEFWALNDVSFELKRGECLGLIGSNGAGKSTLLKILNGLMPPDRGRITMAGSIGALIELNAGFNPILTGRENIYINASIMGVPKKRVNQILDEIVDFSGLENFIDTPVQYYSSGMKVRLGFASSTLVIEPDILLLDEVLAVGDARFRAKCYNRIGQLREHAAVVFVSHTMEQIAHICDVTLFLEKGNMAHFGSVSEGIQKYFKTASDTDAEKDAFETIEYPLKSAQLCFDRLEIRYGDTINLVAEFENHQAMPGALVRIPLYDANGVGVAEWDSQRVGKVIDLEQGRNVVHISLGPLCLKRGLYKVGFVLNDATGIRLPYWSFKQHVISMDGPVHGIAPYQLP